MGNYILVPFNSGDQIENIIPRIEEVAQTGMVVIFLIPYQANGFFKNRRIRAELLAKGTLTDKKALMKYSYEKQTRIADEKTSIAGEALHQRGIKVIAYVYIGPLRRLLKSYKRNGGVHRVLLRRGNAIPMIGFVRGAIALFSSSKRFNSLPHLYCREI
jgi:hypothetical protein